MKPTIAYIPARGGSKRLPGKNTRVLDGKPVLVRVIEALRGAKFIDAVCVSTDDPDTELLARTHGAVTCGFREAALADDFTDFATLFRKDLPRFITALKHREEQLDIVFTFPTAALITSALLTQAHQVFLNRNATLLVSCRVPVDSPYRGLAKTADGGLKPLFPEFLPQRVQDLPETRLDAGMFYMMQYAPIARFSGHWFTLPQGLVCFDAPPEVAIDIDTPEDWSRMEASYHELRRRGAL